jgi:putative hydrolase of the HAD superfamily
MKYKAVIFDLGGTLSKNVAWEEYVNAARKMAEICSAPVEKFVETWFAQSALLGLGAYTGFQDYIRHVCKILELDVADNLIELAGEITLAVTRQYVFNPRVDAIEILSYLKASGYKTGLISDCAPDVPEVWPRSVFAPYFDVTVFSCDEGVNKADPRIFKMAIEKLGVEARDCMYIADGMRNELANAKNLGMRSIQLFVPGERYDSPIREEWHGPTISSLKEIMEYLER